MNEQMCIMCLQEKNSLEIDLNYKLKTLQQRLDQELTEHRITRTQLTDKYESIEEAKSAAMHGMLCVPDAPRPPVPPAPIPALGRFILTACPDTTASHSDACSDSTSEISHVHMLQKSACFIFPFCLQNNYYQIFAK